MSFSNYIKTINKAKFADILTKIVCDIDSKNLQLAIIIYIRYAKYTELRYFAAVDVTAVVF